MTSKHEKILSVPTNVITGFLGVGKTSAILSLLKQKPEHERWAVLVNEFGEIGVDGSLLEKNKSISAGVFIKEVPGGCMCCASGVPTQIALNQLLTEAKPHRLLIEPTGLGHPQEVLTLLSNKYYKKVLRLEKTITLVDARQIADQRYAEHATFNQQLEVADVIVTNKVDLYDEHEEANLFNHLTLKKFMPKELYRAQYGEIKLDWLEGGIRIDSRACEHAHSHQHSISHSHSQTQLHEHSVNNKETKQASLNEHTSTSNKTNTSDFIKAENSGEGYQSVGWRISPSQAFNRGKIVSFLNSIEAIRVKASFITSEGVFGYNKTIDGLNEFALNDIDQSRIEIICDVIDKGWELKLRQATST